MTFALLDRPPTEAEQLDLFALPPRACVDCGKAFQTSRPSDRCALCSSLRTGLVGPATVECVVCGMTHQVAVMSPTKLCELCRADLVIAESNIRADLGLAQQVHDAALEAEFTAAGCATEDDLTRFSRAVQARTSDAPQWQSRWAKSIEKDDGLTVLLRAYDVRRAVAQALSVALGRTRAALQEIEAAR